MDEVQPSAVLVVGDVNSTIACALVAVPRKGMPVIHVEAGLRSFDRAMPEEINRVLTDQLSDLLFTTEPKAAPDNLAKEGIGAERVHFVGNVMIDTLRANLARAIPAASDRGTMAAVPTSRPARANTLRSADPAPPLQCGRPGRAARLAGNGGQDQDRRRRRSCFPVHPRTRATIEKFGLSHLLDRPEVHAACRRWATWRCWA